METVVPSIILGFPSANQKQTINIDLHKNVQELKNVIVNTVNNDWSKFDISFCGIILEDNNSLASYGINPGDILHVLEKPKPKGPRVKKLVTDSDMVTAFRTLTVLAGYRNALMKLGKKEVMDKIIEATPGLIDEPAAIGILQDPELITHILDLDTVTKIATEYPILLQAIQNLLTYVQGEQADTNPSRAGPSTGYSYSLDALSDDDDDMDSDTNMSNNPLTRNSSFNAITAAQLAAAIANATNTQFNTNSAGTPSTPTSSNIITNEMFSSAMQQAFSGPFNVFGSTPSRTEEDSDANLSRRWETQLHQMHEMGLINDTINLRALRATSGEVTAAVELVLSMSSELH